MISHSCTRPRHIPHCTRPRHILQLYKTETHVTAVQDHIPQLYKTDTYPTAVKDRDISHSRTRPRHNPSDSCTRPRHIPHLYKTETYPTAVKDQDISHSYSRPALSLLLINRPAAG
ncbi:hypothetical protein ElyMa_001676600 [Elysia marginata]|uniref:Uncharacterized protein n=1 Tax=Elysia marginata TaxID=1093978 RepID=A0AAV4JQD7_9GAST|nr:hypothetical protein ElyMa_001676600 [Elysia marginata]